jgi:glyoxylase-like metal-dependent hydrolase (beta-lactamase superfamily II)
MKIQHFFDPQTATFTYVVSDNKSNKCAVIDSVLDFDFSAGKISYNSANKIIEYIKSSNLELEWILETHIHADHLTAASYLKEKLGGKIAINNQIKEVLSFWVPFFNNEGDTPLDGSQFDYLFSDGEIFKIGELEARVIHTPGHTPACSCYMIEDNLFVGDTIFMPYVGTARTDFPGASAKTLYNSIQKILSLPNSTKIHVGHDYPLNGESEKFCVTIAEEKAQNIMLKNAVSEEEYVKNRNNKDLGKAVPKLLFPSIQVNLRAGNLGKKSANGTQFIKIPLNKT